jgi:hypothetical protein
VGRGTRPTNRQTRKNQNKVPKVWLTADLGQSEKGRGRVSGDRRRRCLSDIFHFFQKKFFHKKFTRYPQISYAYEYELSHRSIDHGHRTR